MSTATQIQMGLDSADRAAIEEARDLVDAWCDSNEVDAADSDDAELTARFVRLALAVRILTNMVEAAS